MEITPAVGVQCRRQSLSRITMSSVRVSLRTRSCSTVMLVVIFLLELVAKSVAELPFDECRVICDRNSRDQQPQTCNSQCQGYKEHLRIQQQQLTQTNGAPGRDLQRTVDYLLAVTGVTLALVIVVLILMVLMFFNIPRKSATKFALASFLNKQRKKENVDRMVYHKGKSPGTRRKTGSPNGLVSMISASTKEESSASQPTENSLTHHHSMPFGVSTVRTRQPSESTCPEEPSEGYDNLGLSTTTLTLQSADAFGPAVSTITLDTTLNDHEPQQLREVVTSSPTRSH